MGGGSGAFELSGGGSPEAVGGTWNGEVGGGCKCTQVMRADCSLGAVSLVYACLNLLA